jgi:hypothetical protein
VRSPCHDDPLMQALATLPGVRPDETRADQLRARCRALLEGPPRQLPAALEPATIGAVCAMYAWQIVRIVVR